MEKKKEGWTKNFWTVRRPLILLLRGDNTCYNSKMMSGKDFLNGSKVTLLGKSREHVWGAFSALTKGIFGLGVGTTAISNLQK